jgi:hypothetical protein
LWKGFPDLQFSFEKRPRPVNQFPKKIQEIREALQPIGKNRIKRDSIARFFKSGFLDLVYSGPGFRG